MPDSEAVPSPTILARVVLDEATAKLLAAFVAETLDPDQTATASSRRRTDAGRSR